MWAVPGESEHDIWNISMCKLFKLLPSANHCVHCDGSDTGSGPVYIKIHRF